MMIEEFKWYEKKDKNNTATSLGYGARFDPLFKGVKVFDHGDVVLCMFKLPWWMTDQYLPQLKNAYNVLRKYHTIPETIESQDYIDEDKEAYLDYAHNAGPKYLERKKKKKSVKLKSKRKPVKKCGCKK
jgi:hypothetical protein